MTIFCVESSVVDEIHAATNHITGGEGRTVGLSSTAWTETVTVVTVIAVWLLIPARQSIHVYTLHREADSHITITTFAHNLHFEVVQAAWSWYRVRRAYAGSVFVCFAVTWRTNASPTHFMGIGNEIECNRIAIKSVSYKNFSLQMINASKSEREATFTSGMYLRGWLKIKVIVWLGDTRTSSNISLLPTPSAVLLLLNYRIECGYVNVL